MVLGSVTPRLFTPPLITGPPGPCGCGCALTPDTSDGFDWVEFARDSLRRPPYAWQRFSAIHGGELLPDGRPRFEYVYVIVARQNGKALDVDTSILTATRGWTTMGDIRIGDEVFHPNGHATPVTFAGDVQHGRDCYRVTTTDGRSVVADADHLWTVEDRARCTAKGPRGASVRTYLTRTITTGQLLTEGLHRGALRLNGRNEWRWQLPRQEPLKSSDVDLPIDPYLFGAWLGDGTSANAALTCAANEADYWSDAVRSGGYVPKVRHPRGRATRVGITCPPGPGRQSRAMAAKLRLLGVLGDKHIPDCYLTAGSSQREALLQGLLDTDGTIEARRGQVEFCSTNQRMADGVLFLARSLGWRATLVEHRATLRGRDCGPKYRVCFTPTQADLFAPFRMPRKVARVKPSDGGAGRNTVSIASIEHVETRPVRCIKVESPDGLFLAGRGLVATHNTELPVMLSGYWMFVQKVPLILGTSTKLDYAKESWKKLTSLINKSPDQSVRDQLPKPRWTRDANGEQECWTRNESRYKIAASNEEGGRSLTVHKGICDELRQHHNYDAWGALVPAMEAVWDRQLWAMSNAGSAKSIVLNEARAEALEFIKTGEGNWRAGWFEWSAPEGSDPEDSYALAMANPQFNRTIDGESMLLRAAAAKRRGGKALAMFQTESMCINVQEDNPAINPTAWEADKVPGTLDGVRDRIALVWDVSLDGEHATLTAAAALPDGRVRVEPLAAWTFGAAEHGMNVMIKELKEHVRRVKPRAFGWLPTGPAATYAAELTAQNKEGKKVRPKWLPPGTRMEEIRKDLPAVCMGFEEQVREGRVLHSGDPLQDAHVLGAQKLMMGDRWVFTRRGGGHCDAAYSAAGAVHLARTLPPPLGKLSLVVVDDESDEDDDQDGASAKRT